MSLKTIMDNRSCTSLLTDAYIALRKAGMTEMDLERKLNPQWVSDYTKMEPFYMRPLDRMFGGWGYKMEPTEFDKEIAENQKPTKEQEERLKETTRSCMEAIKRHVELEKARMSEWDRWFFNMGEKHPELMAPPKGRWDDPAYTKEQVFKDLDDVMKLAEGMGYEWKLGWRT